MTGLKYQVALSFAGEHRDYVEEVARHLQSRSIDVFYDGFEQVGLWGQSGAEAFHEAFAQESAYVVMFISEAYVSKAWPIHEKRSALSRMIEKWDEYILPVRFDDTPVPGLPTDVIYECAGKHTPAQLATMIAKKLGVQPFDGKASEVPPPRMTSPTGEVLFDYNSYNGCYVIGSGVLEFETKWSSASDTSIHVYNDPPSINGVALARECTSISQVESAASLDYTSRSQKPSLRQIVVLRNTEGFYAALQVLAIKDASRGDDTDELRFRYAIQSDGTDNFSEFVNLQPDAERVRGGSRPRVEGTAETSTLTTPTDATVVDSVGTRTRTVRYPPLGADWISEDEAWARITCSSLLVEREHWHRAGSLRARSTVGDERVRWLVYRFSEDCPEAVREAGGTEFNLEVLLWWIANEAEVNRMRNPRVIHELPPVPPLVPISDLGSPPEPGRKWVSLWNANLDLRGSSLLDQRHRSDAAGLTLTQEGKEWVGWLVWKFAEDCPDAVRGSNTPEPEFNSKVLWWWIRAQAAARGSGKGQGDYPLASGRGGWVGLRMGRKVLLTVLGTGLVVFVTFGLERLVLESWPWWAHFIVAGISAICLWRLDYWWPEKAKQHEARAIQPISEEDRFRALAPRIQELLDTWYSNAPGAGLRCISLIAGLARHLQVLEIPCPERPLNVNEVWQWIEFAEELLPLGELGRLNDARTEALPHRQ